MVSLIVSKKSIEQVIYSMAIFGSDFTKLYLFGGLALENQIERFLVDMLGAATQPLPELHQPHTQRLLIVHSSSTIGDFPINWRFFMIHPLLVSMIHPLLLLIGGFLVTFPFFLPFEQPAFPTNLLRRSQVGLSENNVPLHPMVNDHYPH